ncbi:hypothetical protein M3215_22305 [Bacillus cytotoxicus]|uniref:Uncharacterized protein n=1 Tax=Bacillus cytotoxicus TaxID=580165 RepID=A0ACC6AEU5_9BACI|nr:hypothetical protein [Bacillus cytotoxicus]
MKKIIIAATVLIVTGGFVFYVKGVGAKSIEKKSFEVERIEEVEINNESWDIEFKNTESNKITISAEGKQKDKKTKRAIS